MTRDDQLLIDAIGWLESDTDVQARLGDDGAVVPVAIAKETEADPRLSVGVSETSSERDNTLESKEFEIRVIVDATKSWVTAEEGDGSILDLTRLKARVKAVLTTHRDGWGSTGVIADEEIAWNDDVNRYLGVVSIGFERTDPHAAHS